jgi:hypothetical protein
MMMVVAGILFMFLEFPFRMVRDGFTASIIPPQITYRYDLVFGGTVTVLVVESTRFTTMASDVLPLWLNPTVLNFLFGCVIGFALTWLFLLLITSRGS